MNIPTAWEFVLLALAAWRTWTLLAKDKILDTIRDRYLWRYEDGMVWPRQRILDFLECPYCAGFWIAVGWWAAFTLTGWTVWIAVPWALSATLVAIEATVDRLTGGE